MTTAERDISQRSQMWLPQHVLVERSVQEHPTAREILANCQDAIIHIVDAREASDPEILRRSIDGASKMDDAQLAALSRRCLFLWESQELTQPMATGPAWERRCYNFTKIMPYIGTCAFNCAYCWFKDPLLLPRVNVAFFDHFGGLLDRLRAEGATPTVFTFTQYKTDCFGLEHLTGFCRRVADVLQNEPGFFVQFLTKSSCVDSLLKAPAPTKALVSFSINPPKIATEVDLGTASLAQRLEAAGRLSDAGYEVALRVDPMMVFPGWQQAYRDLAAEVVRHVRPSQVTFGTPRFQSLEEVTRVAETTPARSARRFMAEQLNLMVESKPGQSLTTDSESAYFKNMAVSYSDDTRLALYRNAVDAFRAIDPGLSLGLCEESATVWEAVGLEWTGDRTKDCSCNFIAPQHLSELTPEDRSEVERRRVVALQADKTVRSTGGSATMTPVNLRPRR